MKNIIQLIAVTVITASSIATASNVDFAGWDHDLINSVGQTFDCNGIDVTVTGANALNEFESIFDGSFVRSGADTGTQSYTFTFSEAVDVSYTLDSLDFLETISFLSSSTPVYTHSAGAVPTESGALTLTGNGFGFGTDGAARGVVDFDNITSFTWEYESTGNKFEWFQISKTAVVPEPNSIMLLLIGVLGLIRRRK